MNRLSLDLLWFRGKLDSNLIKFSLTQLHYTIYFLTHFFSSLLFSRDSSVLICTNNFLFFCQESSNAETAKDDLDKEIVNIDSKGAVIFVIAASTFLVLLFFFMSSWFVWVLIVLFCIGGIEVMQLISLDLEFTSTLVLLLINKKNHISWCA